MSAVSENRTSHVEDHRFMNPFQRIANPPATTVQPDLPKRMPIDNSHPIDEDDEEYEPKKSHWTGTPAEDPLGQSSYAYQIDHCVGLNPHPQNDDYIFEYFDWYWRTQNSATSIRRTGAQLNTEAYSAYYAANVHQSLKFTRPQYYRYARPNIYGSAIPPQTQQMSMHHQHPNYRSQYQVASARHLAARKSSYQQSPYPEYDTENYVTGNSMNGSNTSNTPAENYDSTLTGQQRLEEWCRRRARLERHLTAHKHATTISGLPPSNDGLRSHPDDLRRILESAAAAAASESAESLHSSYSNVSLQSRRRLNRKSSGHSEDLVTVSLSTRYEKY